MFYSKSAGEMWNRHIRVPKIAPKLLFPVGVMSCSDEMLIFTFFSSKSIYFKQVIIGNFTKDGSVDAVPRIFYGQYLILGAFGSFMF